MEQEAMASDPLEVSLEGGVGGAMLAGHLSVPGAPHLALRDGDLEVGSLQPVGGGEGL
jgi:hypothetical protein